MLGRRCRCGCCTYRLRERYCRLCTEWSRGGQKGKIGRWIVTPCAKSQWQCWRLQQHIRESARRIAIHLLWTAPRDCMTKPETGCSRYLSCTRGSIPRIIRMRPVGLFRRIFGEYSVSPRPPYNPFSYPVCGVRLLTVKPLFHLF